jgi:hypothetical protein
MPMEPVWVQCHLDCNIPEFTASTERRRRSDPQLEAYRERHPDQSGSRHVKSRLLRRPGVRDSEVTRTRSASFRRSWILCFALVAAAEARLDCARWWCSPSIIAALMLTQEQSAAIEQLYQDSLPTRRQTSEQVMRLTVHASDLIYQRVFDDELLQTTSELVRVRAEEADIRRRALEHTERVLTQGQRLHLAQLLALDGLME